MSQNKNGWTVWCHRHICSILWGKFIPKWFSPKLLTPPPKWKKNPNEGEKKTQNFVLEIKGLICATVRIISSYSIWVEPSARRWRWKPLNFHDGRASGLTVMTFWKGEFLRTKMTGFWSKRKLINEPGAEPKTVQRLQQPPVSLSGSAPIIISYERHFKKRPFLGITACSLKALINYNSALF